MLKKKLQIFFIDFNKFKKYLRVQSKFTTFIQAHRCFQVNWKVFQSGCGAGSNPNVHKFSSCIITCGGPVKSNEGR